MLYERAGLLGLSGISGDMRVLQESTIERLGGNHSFEIDVRFIAATNRNPRVAVAEKQLREDVFYRLNVFNVSLPPTIQFIVLWKLFLLEIQHSQHQMFRHT